MLSLLYGFRLRPETLFTKIPVDTMPDAVMPMADYKRWQTRESSKVTA
jgi:hypothetical protein